jgi:integrase
MGEMPDGSGMKLSSSSIHQYRKILRSAWEVAIEQEWGAKADPWQKTRAPRSKPGSHPTRDAFTPEEIARMLEVRPREWRLPILLASQAGLRLRDAADLRWSSVDLTSRRFPNGALAFTPGKTGRPVVIPISEPLRVELAKTPAEDREGPVCRICGRHSSSLSRAFRRIVDRAGISYKRDNGEIRKLSFHSLRHSFITALKEGGTDSSVSMTLAGHTSAKIHRIYDHSAAHPDLLVNAIEKAQLTGSR